jgi:hypothetical protein
MSFSATIPQIRNATKCVTRRLGWGNLRPGELFVAVEKCQGLKRGQKIKKIRILRCVSNRVELLAQVVAPGETAREGFPDMSPEQFIFMFTSLNVGTERFSRINRIEFSYVGGLL